MAGGGSSTGLTPTQQQTPTEAVGAYGPGSRNYTSIPAVSPLQRFAESDYGKNYMAGFNLYNAAAGNQQTSLYNTGQNLMARVPLLQSGYGTQAGLAQQQYGNQIAGLNVDITGNNAQQNAYRALANINFGGYQNTTSNIANQALQQQRSATHDAVARGAYGNLGTAQDFTDIAANRQYQMGNAENQYLTQQNTVMRNLSELNTQAQKYGLQPAQFANQLQQTLTKLGIDQTMSLSQLMNMIGSNDFQQAALASSIIEKAMGYAQATS